VRNGKSKCRGRDLVEVNDDEFDEVKLAMVMVMIMDSDDMKK
jgi:hypothetical protein